MKKLLLVLLPILITIALIFALNNRNFTFEGFIKFISELRFNSAYNTLIEINDKFNNIKITIESWKNVSNILDYIRIIGNTIASIVQVIILLIKTLVLLLSDLLNNLNQIYGYLFT